MTDFILELPAADALWDDENPRPQPSVQIAEYNDGLDKLAFLTTQDATDWPATTVILGSWDEHTGLQNGEKYDEEGYVTGSPIFPIQSNYGDYVRPLGNLAGVATGDLDTQRWQGHSEKKMQLQDSPYPATDMPFTLQIERTFITDDGYPDTPHGWKVTMLSDDPLRDITARAIGIYDAGGGYLYTTGAFIDDGSGTFFTECPVGQRTADEVDVYFKLLLGSAPEGAWELLIGSGSDDRQFWERDQPVIGGTWQPSGQTVDSMAGTVTIVQDNTVFPIGSKVRIEGTEMVVDSLWNTTGLNLTPYQDSTVGAVVETLQ